MSNAEPRKTFFPPKAQAHVSESNYPAILSLRMKVGLFQLPVLVGSSLSTTVNVIIKSIISLVIKRRKQNKSFSVPDVCNGSGPETVETEVFAVAVSG